MPEIVKVDRSRKGGGRCSGIRSRKKKGRLLVLLLFLKSLFKARNKL